MDGLFKNTHEALTFAFNYSSQQYALSPMAKLARMGATGTGKGLVSTDGAAQAGLVLIALRKMDTLKAHCIIARHSPQYEDCPCCGGKKAIQEWRESVVALRDWAAQWVSGLSHSIVREAIILNYFSRGVSIDDAAKRANIPTRTAYAHRAKIHEQLKLLDAAAQSQIADLLEPTGLFGEQIAA